MVSSQEGKSQRRGDIYAELRGGFAPMAIQVRSESCYESQTTIGGRGVVLGKFLLRVAQQEVSLLFAGNSRHSYFVLICVVGPEYR